MGSSRLQGLHCSSSTRHQLAAERQRSRAVVATMQCMHVDTTASKL